MTFQEDELFLMATEQEKKFFERYVIDRNLELSVLHAYKIKDGDRQAARDYGLNVIKRTRIKGLIERYCPSSVKTALPTLEELRELYYNIYQSADPADVTTRIKALTAYERVSGFSKPPKAKDETFNPLDDIQD